jgi:hypothetical protein
MFALVVDDFGIQYTGKEHDLLETLLFEAVTVDWYGSLFCSITLDWNYNKQHITLSMPGYAGSIGGVQTSLTSTIKHQPYLHASPQYGVVLQLTDPADDLPPLDDDGSWQIQHLTGKFLSAYNAISLKMMMSYLFQNMGTLTTTLADNKKQLVVSWDGTEQLEIVFGCIHECIDFAEAADQPWQWCNFRNVGAICKLCLLGTGRKSSGAGYQNVEQDATQMQLLTTQNAKLTRQLSLVLCQLAKTVAQMNLLATNFTNTPSPNQQHQHMPTDQGGYCWSHRCLVTPNHTSAMCLAK